MYVASLAASTGAILTRMTRLVVTQTGADADAAGVTRRLHDSIRVAFDLLFSGFDEAGSAILDKDN